MQLSLQELCDRLGLSPSNLDPQSPISGVNTLEDAGPGDLSFLDNPKYIGQLASTKAAAVLIREDLAPKCRQALPSANPKLDFVKALHIFSPLRHAAAGVSAQAHVDPGAHLGENCVVYPLAYIGPGAELGANCVIYPGSYVGADCQLGCGCILYPNSVLMDGCKLGDNCVLQPGAVIGGEGFGFVRSPVGIQKVPQIGDVRLGNRVEIGANSTVDRAALNSTTVADGTCVDNLVQIGHNCQIGKDCIIVAQSGIAGSTQLGDNVTLAAKAGIAGHLSIGDNATVGPQSGVAKDVEPGQTVGGFMPSVEMRTALKNAVLFPKLPELFKRVSALEKMVQDPSLKPGIKPGIKEDK